jgi:mitogen-activated protein kinase organizer 1
MALPLPHETIQTLKGHVGPVHVGVYNKDGQYLVTGGADKTIRLWNPMSGMCIKKYTGHGWEILDIDVYVTMHLFIIIGHILHLY